MTASRNQGAMPQSAARRNVTLLLLLLLSFLLLAGGCDDDDSRLCRPEVPAGRIEGFVRTGGCPIHGAVRATRIPETAQYETIVQTTPDSAGFYSLDVPAGRYVVALDLEYSRPVYDYRATGLTYGTAPADTLVVDHGSSPITIDFDLASLQVHVGLSSHLDDEQGEVRLFRRGDRLPNWWRSYMDFGKGIITGGALDILISGILPGEYRVEIVVGRRVYLCCYPYDGEHFWLPGVRDSTQASWIDVPVDQTVEVAADIGSEPARIEGDVVGAWLEMGFSLPPALAILDPDSLTIMGPRTVGDDGHFAVDVYLPGPVKLLVTQAGVEQWIGGDSFEEATIFTLESGRTVSGVRFVQSGFRLAVSTPAAGCSDAWFRLYDPTDLSLVAAAHLVASNSFIGMSNLRPGTYLMEIAPRRPGWATWAPQWFDRMTSPEDARTITIAYEGEVVPLSVILEKGGTIEGTVLMAEGSEVNCYVMITPASERVRWGYCYAWDWQPDYDIRGLPDGDWKVGVWPIPADYELPAIPPDDTVWYPGTTDWNAAGVIEIRDFGDVRDIDIAVQ
ncbi:MAG: hypothetical protein KAY24_04590 [Candidatus Eisenbacteria sp.]|nr:hypothetical protein [Candidatus Eisenbacteria bacterium]